MVLDEDDVMRYVYEVCPKPVINASLSKQKLKYTLTLYYIDKTLLKKVMIVISFNEVKFIKIDVVKQSINQIMEQLL